MNPRILTIGLAALALAGLAPAAHAETVGVDASGAVVVTAAPGERNNLGLQSWDDGGIAVYDSRATLTTTSAACSQQNENLVVCPLDPAAGARADLGDGDDWGYVSFDLPADARFSLSGGAGNDRLQSSQDGQPTTLDGGAGNDTLQGGTGADTLIGGDGDDTLTGREGSDRLLGGAGNDDLSGDGNADPSADVIDGGAGYDTTDVDWETEDDAPVAVTLAGGADDGRAGERDDVRGVEQVITHQGSTLIGTDAPEHLEAFQTDASSRLVGNGGDDTLRGSDGPDSVDGGAGDDDIDAGFGDDTIVGGPGRDRISGDRHNGECGYLWCKYPWGNDTIYARDGEVDSIDCGAGADTVYADAADVVSSDCEHVVRAGGGSGPGPGSAGRPAAALTVSIRHVRHGLKLRVFAPAAGRLKATAKAHGRTVATASRKVRAGRTTIVMRFTRRLRHVKLTVSVRLNGARLTKKVVLQRA
jgi:Ca2+-binding RTX toxin-like protein